MRNTVYLDLLFLVNFCVDALLLVVSGNILGRKLRWRRILAGASVGAGWSCLLVILMMPEWLETVLTIGPLAILMKEIAWGNSFRFFRKELAINLLIRQMKEVVMFYLTVFLFGGFLYAIWFRTGSMPASVLISLLLLISVLVCISADRLRAKLGKRYCRVKLVWLGIAIELTGLVDTGNSLKTADGRPVHVINRKAAAPWLNLTMEKVMMIPYRSVGIRGSTLPAITADEIWIDGNPGGEPPVIAFSPYPVCADNRYQILLHPQEGFA